MAYAGFKMTIFYDFRPISRPTARVLLLTPLPPGSPARVIPPGFPCPGPLALTFGALLLNFKLRYFFNFYFFSKKWLM